MSEQLKLSSSGANIAAGDAGDAVSNSLSKSEGCRRSDKAGASPDRPFEEQTFLERTLRAHLYHPVDFLRTYETRLKGALKNLEYREAADLQSRASKAKLEVDSWNNLLNLYELERSDRDRLHRILTRILSKEGIHTKNIDVSVTMNEVNGTKTTEELIEFLEREMNEIGQKYQS